MGRTGTVGWLVPESERQRLLEKFHPAYPDVIAHHVTLQAGVTDRHPLPAQERARIIGIADDGQGVQALVVEIGGTTDRPDGSTYHITWTLDRARGRTAVQSNDVIRGGWKPVEPTPVQLSPAFMPG